MDNDALSWAGDLLALASDWVWEQDAAFRFTRLQGLCIEGIDSSAASSFLGKCRWEIGLKIQEQGGWDVHRAQLASHQPFRDLLLYRPLADGSRRYLRISGMPIFDAQDQFKGYRGFGKDVTQQELDRNQLLHFKAVLDRSPNPVFVACADSMQAIYVNDAACQALGCTREELLRLPPEVLAQLPVETLQQLYADAAANPSGITLSSVLLSSLDGKRRGWWDVHWQTLDLDGTQLMVTTSREVSERKLAEEAVQRIARTFALLSTLNEAMLRATAPAELYQQACRVAVEAGELIGAAILMQEPDTDRLKVVAANGKHIDTLQQAYISIDPSVPEGQGLAGVAYRTGQPCTSEEFLTDARTRYWRAQAEQAGVRTGAAIPLLRKQKPFGVLLLYSAERRAFDAEIIALLQRMAASISYALEAFEQEAQRLQAEEALRRSEEKYRTILEDIEDAYYEVDLNGTTTFCNSAFCRMLGYTEAELVGGNYRDFMRAEVAVDVEDAFQGVYHSGQSIKMLDWELIRKDGSLLLVESSVQLIRDAEGAPVGFRGIIRDLTERRREERLLALEHAVTRRLAESESTRRSLRAVTRIMCESEQWGAGGYYSLDPVSGMARLVAGWRQPVSNPAAKSANAAVAVDVPAGGLVSSVAATGQPLWVQDLAGDPRATWHPPVGEDKQGRLFFPVRAEGNVIGVFIFRTEPSQQPEQRLLQTVAVIGDQVGQFLQRKRVEQGLRESEARFRSLTELSSDWYWEQDAKFRFTRLEGRHMVNGESLEGKEWLGRSRWQTNLTPDDGSSWVDHQAALAANQPFKDFIFRRTLTDGSLRYISVSGEPIRDRQGKVVGYRGVGRDVTDSKRAEEQIRYLATHDSLTELPNRMLFGQLLSAAIKTAKRQCRGFSVMFIDLDRFKLVNDTFGHEAGDSLLKEVAQRLQRTLRTSDTIARLGGDEFVVLLEETDTHKDTIVVAEKILAALAKPLHIHGRDCQVTASIGICMYPIQAHDEQSLMQNADTAMYLAKTEGRNSYRFYDPEEEGQASKRLALEAELRQALEQQQFKLHYQAKLDLRTGRIAGVEALLRWNHPQQGIVPPNQFIPLAEETGLIVPIGRWVLRTACQQNAAWLQQGLPPVVVAVNLSPRQFQDNGLLDDIKSALRLSGLPPQLLELELTEGMVMQNSNHTAQTLEAIKALGIQIAMDDFGVGYSSLAQLKGFPIDTLKVDRSFVHNLPENAQDRAITKAIVALAKSLDLRVIAEGVETEAQESFLREIAFDQSQGFYFSRPIAAEAFAKLLQETSSRQPLST